MVASVSADSFLPLLVSGGRDALTVLADRVERAALFRSVDCLLFSSPAFAVLLFSLDSDRQFLTVRAADATGCPLRSLRSRVACSLTAFGASPPSPPGLWEGVSSETQTEKEN
jgi:hypothetical protein